MVKTIVRITTAVTFVLAASIGFAAPQANFSTDKFDNFTLHTYASFDAMANVSFIVESANKLVIIEPQAFKGKVKEFVDYTNKLGKPIDKVLVSYHAAGLKVYNDEQKVITKPMAGFMKSDAAKGMLKYFDKSFEGAMDTEIVEFDQQIDPTTTFTVDGVNYQLESSAVPGMPGSNIAIGEKVYYQHFAPAKGSHPSKHLIGSRAAIDGALADAIKAKKASYSLLLGSHGFGKAGVDDLKFQISYLEAMKRVAERAGTADDFIIGMNRKFPGVQGEEDLKGIAAKLYK